MASLDSLPLELLERILCSTELRASDVLNCAEAFPCFRNLCYGKNFWRMKLKLHFPNVYAKYQRDKISISPRELYCLLCSLHDRMCEAVMALSKVFVWSLYHDYEWPDIPHRALSTYLNLFHAELGTQAGKYYVLDECYNIMHSGDRHRNLTLKYYAQKVYCFVNVSINFDSIWESVSLQPTAESSQSLIIESNTQFDFYQAAMKLAVSIPVHQRVDEQSMAHNLNQLYSYVEEQIKQYNPYILKKRLRVNLSDTSNDSKRGAYNTSECVFLLKQVHDCIRHEFKFCCKSPSVYKGYKYCLDKVLKSRLGYHKLLVTLEAHLAQRYGVGFEIHEDRLGIWRIFYQANDGKSGYYVCPTCYPASRTGCAIPAPAAIITETSFYRSILESLVENFESRLKIEWELAGGPMVHNLLWEDTYIHPMREVFRSWRHVEHWKIAALRHYTLLLMRVSDDTKLEGKLLHLNILLRVRSNYTLEALTNFRRELVSPPSGIRELQRMVASVNIRARARYQELQAMLETRSTTDKTFFLATFHPSQIRPWPHGYAGSDMVQKRRVDRKSWYVQFAIGQVVRRRRWNTSAGAAHQMLLSARTTKPGGSGQRVRSKSGNRLVSEDEHSRDSSVAGSDNESNECSRNFISSSEDNKNTTSVGGDASSSSSTADTASFVHGAVAIPRGSSSGNTASTSKDSLTTSQEANEGTKLTEKGSNKACENSKQICLDSSRVRECESRQREDVHETEDSGEPPRKMDRIELDSEGPRSSGLCVIFDWDSMCVESEETLMIMGETNLTCGTDQPFYRVLLDDGSSSYVAQENLQHTQHPKPINNPLLGRYFRAYERKYYIPNMQKAYEYPEDATIREQDSFILSHF